MTRSVPTWCTATSVTATNEEKEGEFDLFATACQALSTRGFHMDVSGTPAGTRDSTTTNSAPDSYSGPFLLPVIDLLNHALSTIATDRRTCTTLQRNHSEFVMVAERDLAIDEELTHSYGDHLCSSQFLASFGFVPEDAIERAITMSSSGSTQQQSTGQAEIPITPAILSKTKDIWPACWEVIESDLPRRLAASMQEQSMEDEVWPVAVDTSRTADYVPEDILISTTSASTIDPTTGNVDIQQLHLLTDDLVTAATVPFLPKCAYSEITERTLLDCSILEDYYLGKLVGTALLKSIQKKMETYTAIPETVVRQFIPANTKNSVTEDKDSEKRGTDDSELLQRVGQATG